VVEARRCLPYYATRRLQARQRLLQEGDGSRATADGFSPEGSETCSTAGPEVFAAAAQAPHGERDMNEPTLATHRPEDEKAARARALKSSDVCFVGHRPGAVGRLQFSPALPTRPRPYTLDLRVRHARDKPRSYRFRSGRRLCRYRARLHGVGARDVPLLAAGRPHTVGFLGRRPDRPLANLNTTVVGPYHKRRCYEGAPLPGGGGAPVIAISCGEIFIIMEPDQARGIVDKLDFVTSIGTAKAAIIAKARRVHDRRPDPAITELMRFAPRPRDQDRWTVVSIPTRRHP